MVAEIKGSDMQMVLSTGMHQSHEKEEKSLLERTIMKRKRIGGKSRNEV